MPTMIDNTRSTEAILQARKVVDMSSKITMLEGNRTQLFKLVSRFGKEPAKNIRFDWLTDEIRPKFDTTTQSRIASDTTVTMTGDGTTGNFAPGDVLFNATTGERIRVVVSGTTGLTLAIARGVGATAAAAIANGEQLILVSRVYGQGKDLYAAKSTKENSLFNFTQLQRDHFDITGTEDAMGNAGGLYGGSDRADQRAKIGLEHARAINHTAYFGERPNTVGVDEAGASISYTGGITQSIFMDAANINASLTATTEIGLDNGLRGMMRYGSEEKWLMVSRDVAGYIQQALMGKSAGDRLVRLAPGDNKYGLNINQYNSTWGTVNIVQDVALEGNVPKKWAVLIDPEDVKLRTLRDTVLLVDRKPGGSTDRILDEYMTEYGFQWGHPKNHGMFNAIAS